MPYDGILLGVDPSLRGTGLAVIAFKPGETARLLSSQTVKIKANASMPECLAAIAEAIFRYADDFNIQEAAVEQTIYVQNFQTAQILGAARGAALTALALRGIPIAEYAPLRIKQAVVGFGRASKDQVAGMIRSQLALAELLSSDESDAAAAALCHATSWRPV